VSFFDDEPVPAEPPPPPRPRRPKRDRTRTRVQRLVVLIVALVVVVFLLAVGVRHCQQTRRESAYRTYFSNVQGVIADSEKVGRELGVLLDNPTKLSNKDLATKLNELAARQQEIASRAQRIKPPAKLADLHQIFILGMKVRARGVEQVRDGLLAALGKKNTEAAARRLAALSGYFSGPEIYYRELFQTQAQKIMADDGVKEVTVPAFDFFLRNDFFDPQKIDTALKRAAGSVKTTGIHGVSLKGVVVKPADVTLVAGKSTQVESAPELSFAVTVQNQGSVTENDVPVKVMFNGPGSNDQRLEGTIAAIAPGDKETVEIGGLVPPDAALTRESTVEVTAGPVSGEKVTDNNSASYGVILVIPQP